MNPESHQPPSPFSFAPIFFLFLAKNRVYGDLMVIGAAILYACSNVLEELLLRGRNRTEVLGMWGIFGCIISGIQM